MPTLKLVASIFLLIILIGCDSPKSEKDLIDSALSYEAKGEFDSASIQLKNILRENPKNDQARFLLGGIYLKQGLPISAEKELALAKDNGYENEQLIPYLAKVYYQLHNSEKLDELTENSQSYSEQTLVTIYIYRGLHELYLGDRDKAEQEIALANSISENAIYSKLGSAWLKATDSSEEALALVSSLLAENNNFSDAIMLKGHIHSLREEHLAAAKAYEQYIELHPYSYEVHQFKANSLLSANEHEEAELIIDNLLNLFPNHAIINQLKAKARYADKDFEKAEIHADKSLSSVNQSVPAALISAASAYHQQKYEKSYSTLRKIERDLPPTHPAKKLYAVLQLELGYAIESANSFDNLADFSADDVALLETLSVEFWKSGVNSAAQKLMTQAAELTPDDVEKMTRLGAMNILQGDASGIKDIEKALEIDPAFAQANFALAFNHIEKEEYEKALELATTWKEQKSNEDYAFILEGLIYSKKNELKKAKVAFKNAMTISPSNITAIYYHAVMLEYDGQAIEALKQYKDVAKNTKTHFGALAGIIRTSDVVGEQNSSIEFLKGLISAPNKDTALLRAISQILVNNGATGRALQFLLSYTEKLSDNIRYLSMLAELQVKDEQYQEGIDTYTKLQSLDPTNATHWLKLLNIYASTKDYTAGIEKANSAISLFNDIESFKLIKAQFEMYKQEPEKAEKTLETISIKEAAALYKVKGSLYMIQNNFPAAISEFTQLYSIQPVAVNLINLAKAYIKNGEINKAIELIEQRIDEKPTEYATQLLAADLHSKSENWREAKKHYKNVLKNINRDYVTLNNYASTLLELKDYTQALVISKEAYNLNSSNPHVMDTYGYSLLKNGKSSDALNILSSAYKLAPQNFGISLHLSEAYILNSKVQEATKILLDAKPQNENDKNKVKSLFDKMGS